MARLLQSSGTRLVRRGARLVQGLRENSSWFVHNIIAARPDVPARADPRIRRRHPPATRPNEPGQLQVIVARQEVRSDTLDAGDAAAPVPSPPAGGRTLKSVRKLKRIGGRAVVALNIVDEEHESDSEDFGRVRRPSPSSSLAVCVDGTDPCNSYSITTEDSYGPSEYHTAISHLTDLSGLVGATLPQLVDESSGAVFISIAMGPEERFYPTSGSIAGEFHPARASSAPTLPIAEASANLLTAPSLMLTLPTPQIAQSPVFRPRSPITLFKYVEATTPTRESNLLSFSAVTSPSASPAPSIPTCDRCCLAQLEDGLICRACEKQWLACKMWYQAHDGGRRRWLTEPYIKPAESTASVRAVMGRLGVPGTGGDAHRGLGLGSSVSFQQELPFRVLATPSVTSSLHVRSAAGTGSWATRLGYQIAGVKRVVSVRPGFLAFGAARKARAGLRTLWSMSLGLFLSGPLSRGMRSSQLPTLATSYDSSGTSCAVDIGGHRRAASSTGSVRCRTLGLGCITSSSRFVEDLF